MNTVVETRYRVQSIDVLRGLVMVIMALDHVRDYFHVAALTANPLDPATTTPTLFFTRWITHFCAPVFVLLAGTSAYLVGQRKGLHYLRLFLIKRGVWLVLAEVIIMSFALSFNPNYNMIFLQVIWVIGVSMILLGLMLYLPFRAVVGIGLVLLLGHNGFDSVELPPSGAFSFIMKFFVTGSAAIYPLSANHVIMVLYKVLPWTAVMTCGYSLGYLFRSSMLPATRRKALAGIGIACLLLFVMLRLSNAYGDPFQWQPQKDGFRTLLSFINTTKYPPSLLFVCMTLGPALLLLAFIENAANAFTRFLTIFGRVPFFYFIVHFFLIHALCVVAFYATGHTNSQIVDPASPFWFRPAAFGFSLPIVYAVWLLVVALMYPLCRWYGHYKSTHAYWWLSYL